MLSKLKVDLLKQLSSEVKTIFKIPISLLTPLQEFLMEGVADVTYFVCYRIN